MDEQAELTFQSLGGIAGVVRQDMQALQDTDMTPLTRKIAEGPAIPAVLRELNRADVAGIDLPEMDDLPPQDRLRKILQHGAQALKDNGLPEPDLDMYDSAKTISQTTDIPLAEVLDEFDRVKPQEVYVRDGPDAITLTGVGADTVGPPDTGSRFSEIPGLQAQTYTEYDVHFMMYPLGHDIGKTGIETRPSHAFIVVTEPGVDSLPLRKGDGEALIVTRGGPDRGTYDFRLDTDIQSPTENNPDGDVYVKDHEGSSGDLNAGGVRLIETTRIRGDLDDIRDNVEAFRRAVNSTDINYHAPYQNSNTYAGDVYENLTGKDAPDTIQWPHYMPGLGRDLPVEGDYSYVPDDQETEYDVGL